MSDEKQNPAPAAEPLLWAFYQQLPGRSGGVGVCTVRSKEEVEELRENGIEVFPLYAEPVEKTAPPPRGLGTTPPRRPPDPANAQVGDWDRARTGAYPRMATERRYISPPLTLDELDPTPDAETVRERLDAKFRDLLLPSAVRHGVASGPIGHDTQNSLRRKLELLAEALLPFAAMAELVAGREDDETLLSLQSGPLQWKHITAADIRRAGAALVELGEV